MKNLISIDYYDRQNNMIENESVFASKFLHWSYNNYLGRILTNLILSRKFISKLYGLFAKSKSSKRFIKYFIRHSKMSSETIKSQLESYNSFNDFFIRKLHDSDRPVDKKNDSLTAPSDGKVLAYHNINGTESFQIKRNLFDLSQFLKNENLTSDFSGGTMIIIRLSLSDYHHFSFPVSGFAYNTTRINGKLYAGGSYSLKKITPFYTENVREITLINSDHFGLVAQIEIGAFTVGSIKQLFKSETRIQKGEPKGCFELGGSTIVLLFKKDMIIVDNDILQNSLKEIETKILLGEKLGRNNKDIINDSREFDV